MGRYSEHVRPLRYFTDDEYCVSCGELLPEFKPHVRQIRKRPEWFPGWHEAALDLIESPGINAKLHNKLVLIVALFMAFEDDDESKKLRTLLSVAIEDAASYLAEVRE